MSLIAFLFDQHGIATAEKVAIKLLPDYHLKLGGDTCVHQSEDAIESMLKLRFKESGQKRKRKEEFYKGFIAKLSKGHDDYSQMLVWYGCSPIFTLARCLSLSSETELNDKSPLTWIRGNEKILDKRQKQLHEIISEQECIKPRDMLGFLMDELYQLNPDAYEYVMDSIDGCGFNPRDYIFETLNPKLKLYGGVMPTAYDVVKNFKSESFRFIERLTLESVDGTIIIHVPFYDQKEEKARDVIKISKCANQIRKYEPDKVLLVYHGNPNSQRLSRGRRVDGNKMFIDSLLKGISTVYSMKNVIMLNGHLHKTPKRNPINYRFAPNQTVKSYALNIDEAALVDTSQKDSVKVVSFKQI